MRRRQPCCPLQPVSLFYSTDCSCNPLLAPSTAAAAAAVAAVPVPALAADVAVSDVTAVAVSDDVTAVAVSDDVTAVSVSDDVTAVSVSDDVTAVSARQFVACFALVPVAAVAAAPLSMTAVSSLCTRSPLLVVELPPVAAWPLLLVLV